MKVEANRSLATAALVLGVAMLSSCGASASREAAAAPAEKARNPLEIHPSADLLTRLKVGPPHSAQVAKTLRVAGRVEADERRLARVGSPVSGRITEILAFEGQRVKRGQPVAKLHSTQLSEAQFAFIKAFSQQQLAKRSTERAKQLLDADVIGTAEVQRRQAEYEQALAEVSSLRAQLRVLGMSDQAITGLEQAKTLSAELQMVASIEGTVLERKVTIGQIVQPAETAFLIADLSNVWLVADIPEQSAGTVTVGRRVQAEIPALPGQTVSGRLSFVSSIVNAETGTVRTRMDLPNPRGLFKPAMLATMILQDTPERQEVIPVTSVVREENTDHVFVETKPGTFVLREVSLGDQFRDSRVVKDGVTPDEKIVLDGAFHLNNERKRLAIGS